jgi:hypothetical protein
MTNAKAKQTIEARRIKNGAPTADDAYMAKQAEACRLLDALNDCLIDHEDEARRGKIHWGHCGDLDGINETLQDLHDRLTGNGEYADYDNS